MGFIQDRQIVDETGMTGHFEFTIAISAAAIAGDRRK
jgi:predicted flavoprotein YhiN